MWLREEVINDTRRNPSNVVHIDMRMGCNCEFCRLSSKSTRKTNSFFLRAALGFFRVCILFSLWRKNGLLLLIVRILPDSFHPRSGQPELLVPDLTRRPPFSCRRGKPPHQVREATAQIGECPHLGEEVRVHEAIGREARTQRCERSGKVGEGRGARHVRVVDEIVQGVAHPRQRGDPSNASRRLYSRLACLCGGGGGKRTSVPNVIGSHSQTRIHEGDASSSSLLSFVRVGPRVLDSLGQTDGPTSAHQGSALRVQSRERGRGPGLRVVVPRSDAPLPAHERGASRPGLEARQLLSSRICPSRPYGGTGTFSCRRFCCLHDKKRRSPFNYARVSGPGRKKFCHFVGKTDTHSDTTLFMATGENPPLVYTFGPDADVGPRDPPSIDKPDILELKEHVLKAYHDFRCVMGKYYYATQMPSTNSQPWSGTSDEFWDTAHQTSYEELENQPTRRQALWDIYRISAGADVDKIAEERWQPLTEVQTRHEDVARYDFVSRLHFAHHDSRLTHTNYATRSLPPNSLDVDILTSLLQGEGIAHFNIDGNPAFWGVRQRKNIFYSVVDVSHCSLVLARACASGCFPHETYRGTTHLLNPFNNAPDTFWLPVLPERKLEILRKLYIAYRICTHDVVTWFGDDLSNVLLEECNYPYPPYEIRYMTEARSRHKRNVYYRQVKDQWRDLERAKRTIAITAIVMGVITTFVSLALAYSTYRVYAWARRTRFLALLGPPRPSGPAPPGQAYTA